MPKHYFSGFCVILVSWISLYAFDANSRQAERERMFKEANQMEMLGSICRISIAKDKRSGQDLGELGQVQLELARHSELKLTVETK